MSLPLTELVVLVAIVVIVSAVLRIRSRKNYPPGPRGIPILGYIPFLRGEVPRCFKEIANKYGSIFSIRLGTTDIVVLNDWKVIKEALTTRDKDLAGRPSNFLWRKGLKDKGIFVAHASSTWKEEKRFLLKYIKTRSARSVDGTVPELTRILDRLQTKRKIIVDDDLLFRPQINLIINLITGKEHVSDQSTNEIRKNVEDGLGNGGGDSLVNFIPSLRFLPGHVAYHAFIKSLRDMRHLLRREIDEHKAKFQASDDPKDFIDAYCQESMRRANQDRGFHLEGLESSCAELFYAAGDTINSTLRYALLYMALWPEIQAKVQQELDEVIGKSRLPEYKDHKLLPYTEATILEVHRFASVAPLAAPHASIKDTEVGGFAIPKDTYILINLWALHHDENLWGDPEVFRPERFLDDAGKVKKPEYLKPFSSGLRVCAGESLANIQVFHFFTKILQRFSFHSVTGEAPLTLETTTGLTTKPKPYHLMAKPRF